MAIEKYDIYIYSSAVDCVVSSVLKSFGELFNFAAAKIKIKKDENALVS